MAVNLDTHRLVKELIAAGFTEVQAEAVTRAVAVARDLDLSHLATEAGVEQRFLLQQRDFEAKFDALRKDVDTKIEAFRKDVDAKIEALHRDVDAKIEALHRDVDAKIEALHTDMKLLKRDMTIRLGAMIAAAVVIVTALDQLL